MREIDPLDLVATIRGDLLVLEFDLTVRFAHGSVGDAFTFTPKDAPTTRRAGNERQSKTPVRSQGVSPESKRWASRFRLSEGSNRVQAGRSFGCRFLHSEGQGQEDRR